MAEPPFAEVREALRRELARKRLRAPLWADLVQSRYVQLVSQRRMSIERLAEVYLLKEETFFPYKRLRRERTHEPEPDKRGDTLAQLVALVVDTMVLGVKEFREQVLDGKLLAYEEIAPWVTEQAAREGRPAASYLKVPLAEAHPFVAHILLHRTREEYAQWLAQEAERIAATPKCELPRGWTESAETLTFPNARGRPKLVTIRGDATLAYLKSLAFAVSGGTLFAGWAEHQSVGFILSDAIPITPRARVQVKEGFVRASSQIELRLGLRLAPTEVARLYQEARARLLGKRDRVMDEKHLALALFAHRTLWSGPLAGWPWTKLRARWNELHPEWRYETELDEQARRFALDVRAAWERLTGDAWPDRRRKWRPRTGSS